MIPWRTQTDGGALVAGMDAFCILDFCEGNLASQNVGSYHHGVVSSSRAPVGSLCRAPPFLCPVDLPPMARVYGVLFLVFGCAPHPFRMK